ncbi:hypothetical protein F5I97DRAFT_1902033 [Phlebopus sp. FC_14]|nr:hypothetical protein F5I97DRAFT_1902033 [Phlebopus sp. FC_14]
MFPGNDQLEGYLDLALLLEAPNDSLPEPETVGKTELSFSDLLDIAREYEQAHQPEFETMPTSVTSEALPQPQCAVNAMLPVNSHVGTSHEGPAGASPQPHDPGPYHLQALESMQPSIDEHANTPSMSQQVYQSDTPLDQGASRHPDNKENQTRTAPKLLGWSPLDGSDTLDLESPEMHYPPWLAKLLNPSLPERLPSWTRSCPMQSENDVPRLVPGLFRVPKQTEFPRAKAIPLPSARLGLRRAVLGSVEADICRKPTYRPYSTTTTAAGYASAPRGGVPPQLARDVTKANILRVEQEREKIRKAAASNGVDLRKPSVLNGLEKPAKARGETADLAELKRSVSAYRGRKRAYEVESTPLVKRTRL